MRGVEAPFQLLVSVFTMVLVVAIAFHVLNTVSTQRCNQMWDQSVTALANAISRTAMSEPPTTDVVTLRLRCGDAVGHMFYVISEEKSRCAKVCGEYTPQCYILVHQAYNRKNEIISTNMSCIKNFSPYLYGLLVAGKDSCGYYGGYGSFFNGDSPPTSEEWRGSGADLNGFVTPSPVSMPVYVFRDKDKIVVCRKRG